MISAASTASLLNSLTCGGHSIPLIVFIDAVGPTLIVRISCVVVTALWQAGKFSGRLFFGHMLVMTIPSEANLTALRKTAVRRSFSMDTECSEVHSVPSCTTLCWFFSVALSSSSLRQRARLSALFSLCNPQSACPPHTTAPAHELVLGSSVFVWPFRCP